MPVDTASAGIAPLSTLGSTRIAAAVAAAAVLALFTVGRKWSHKPKLYCAHSPFMEALLSRCTVAHQEYHVQPTLANCHVETIVASKLRRNPGVQYRRELLIMQDGGTVAVDYEQLPEDKELPANAPVIMLLPGLTGGSHDRYVQHMVINARLAGFRAVVFNSRGTSDAPVSTPQFYSASFTGDCRAVANHLAQHYPDSPLFAMGYSLGANILVRYLGEEGAATPIKAAVSLCNPFNLPISDRNFHKGFNRIYDINLANSLRTIFAPHLPAFRELGGEYDLALASSARTIREFDDAITRVSFGFKSVDAYYEGSSSSLSIPDVEIPLLCIQAENDPIAPNEAIPYQEIQAHQHCALVVTPTGGHLGWMSGKDGPFGAPWTDDLVVEFFTAFMAEMYQKSAEGSADKAAQAQAAPLLRE